MAGKRGSGRGVEKASEGDVPAWPWKLGGAPWQEEGPDRGSGAVVWHWRAGAGSEGAEVVATSEQDTLARHGWVHWHVLFPGVPSSGSPAAPAQFPTRQGIPSHDSST